MSNLTASGFNTGSIIVFSNAETVPNANLLAVAALMSLEVPEWDNSMSEPEVYALACSTLDRKPNVTEYRSIYTGLKALGVNIPDTFGVGTVREAFWF